MAEIDGDEQSITQLLHVGQTTGSYTLTTVHLTNLYLSHALSTWNARTYEFAVILFTASAFPDTLFASSVRGLCNTLASLCFLSMIGTWIDGASSRLRTLLLTICANRSAVIVACLGWVFLISDSNTGASWGDSDQSSHPNTLLANNKSWLFATVILLGIFEKLSGIGNMISMERDWVPAFAITPSAGGASPRQLTRLNAVMRRIDLICKLVAPVVISIIVSATSMRIGVMAVTGMSGMTRGIEVWCARRVWRSCPELRHARARQSVDEIEMLDRGSPTAPESNTTKAGILWLWHSQSTQIRTYFSTSVWIPSLSLALLHLSVLSYSATFITYLLNTGFSLLLITVARALGSIVEVSSTFIAPLGIEYLARSRKQEEDAEELLPEEDLAENRHGVGLERTGLWGLSLQLLSLIPVVLAVIAISPPPSRPIPTLLSRFLPSPSSLPLSILLFTSLSLSRLGLWTFDLTTQELTQTRIPPSTRSSFAGVEMSFVSLFELMQWISGMVLAKPEQFRWLAMGSLGAVAIAGGMYAGWVRGRRGHLVHWERCGGKGRG